MFERFYWWIGMSIWTRGWLRNYYRCQARKISRLTGRWPIISMPLPEGPGIAASTACFGPNQATCRSITCILLVADQFSRRADMSAVTAPEFTAEGTASILINRYTPLWGCPCSILPGNGLGYCSNILHVIYEFFGVRKVPFSSALG